MPIRKPTSNEVQMLRLRTGEGVICCKSELQRYFVRKALEDATTFEELKDVLLEIVPHSMFGPEYLEGIV